MPRPTAADLLERLREVYERENGEKLSDEKLAAKLPVSLSTVNRWKTVDTKTFSDIVEMLDQAGWLQVGEQPTVRPSAGVGLTQTLRDIAREITELANRVSAQQEPPVRATGRHGSRTAE